MGVLGAFFGCRGDGGFTLVCISGCRGVSGFNVVTSQLPVREKVRPARSDGGREREKVRPACSKWPKFGVLWRAGRTFSRNSRGTNCAGRTISRNSRGTERAGRVFRAYRHGSHVSHVMWRPTCRKWWGFCTTRSPLAACRRRVGASCSAIPPSGGRGGVRTCRGPGGWTLRLAVLTRRCAAKPYWWHGGQPAQATTSRVNVRIKGPRCPPAGPVRSLMSIRVGRARRATRRSRRSKAPDRDGGR